jgi:group I intron endonuclease
MTTNKYSNGKIYRLVNNVDDNIYVGSTYRTLSQRKSGHKVDAKTKTEQKVYKHLNEVGWENFDIILIENYPCNNKDELNSRERYFNELLKPELNSALPLRTDREWREANKKQIAKKAGDYYQANKDQIAENVLEHRTENKEK